MRQIDINFPQNNCEIHGTSSGLPCAWPNCENSIKENEFEGVSIGTNKFKYVRRKWQSPLGDYYSWDKLDLPNWFSVKEVFWNEARRHNLVSNQHPNIVYHYTSLEGLIGIIENRAVWMTDFGYLNDRQELNHGISLVSDSLNKMLESDILPNVKELLLEWKNTIKQTPNRVCITSFSADGDSLSQWRAYGPVAIGLPVKDLLLHVESGIFQHVEYDFETQEKLVNIYLNHLVNAFVVDMKEGRLENAPDLYHKNDRLLDFITFFKNPAFKSENEYRLAYINNPEVLATFDLSTPPKYFRVANGKIIPYVPSTSISLSGIDKFPLKIEEIVIGPENDELLEQGIRELLSENGLSDVSIRKSIVPLRK
jgi:hypothetical protein